jgi:hypothetical protein
MPSELIVPTKFSLMVNFGFAMPIAVASVRCLTVDLDGTTKPAIEGQVKENRASDGHSEQRRNLIVLVTGERALKSLLLTVTPWLCNGLKVVVR